MEELTDEEYNLVIYASRRVTKKVTANFDLYVLCSEDFNFCGGDHGNQVHAHPDGVTALQAFNAVDSMGINPPCAEPDVLRKVWNAKASLNFHIKMWAEGISDGLFCLAEFQDSYPYLPDWVWDAVRGQVTNWNGFRWYYEKKFKGKFDG